MKPIETCSDAYLFQKDVDAIYNYCQKNSLKLNPEKTFNLRIRYRGESDFGAHIYNLNGDPIEIVKSHKHLGIFLDSKFNFANHVNNTTEKAQNKLNYLIYALKTVSGRTFLKAYTVYIRPLLEYNFNCYTPNKKQTKQLEGVQKRATKIACYKMKKYNLDYIKRLRFLGLMSIEKRRKLSMIKIAFKISVNSNNIPQHWKDQVSMKENPRTGKHISAQNFKQKKSDNYPIVQACNLYNGLPTYIKRIPSIGKFMRETKRHMARE